MNNVPSKLTKFSYLIIIHVLWQSMTNGIKKEHQCTGQFQGYKLGHGIACPQSSMTKSCENAMVVTITVAVTQPLPASLSPLLLTRDFHHAKF
jgi:hypothetical protein